MRKQERALETVRLLEEAQPQAWVQDEMLFLHTCWVKISTRGTQGSSSSL